MKNSGSAQPWPAVRELLIFCLTAASMNARSRHDTRQGAFDASARI
jgi:hypothetical protein